MKNRFGQATSLGSNTNLSFTQQQTSEPATDSFPRQVTEKKRKVAEKEKKSCEGCTGLCRKATNRWVIPQEHGVALCRYGARRLAAAEAHIPARYIGKTFADYEVTADNAEAVQIAEWYATQKPAKNLYLYGICGTGKTMLAAIVAQEFDGVQFANVPELMDMFKATFDNGGTESLLKRYTKCPLLVLDDIGAGNITPWHVNQLYQIINTRYNANLPLIATSNCDFNALEKLLTGRIVSRLSENTVQAFLGLNDRRRQSC